MITKEIKNFIEFRDQLISELFQAFNFSIDHERSDINYNIIADNIIKLIDEYEQKINNSEIDNNE